jgi:hypothetical protein
VDLGFLGAFQVALRTADGRYGRDAYGGDFRFDTTTLEDGARLTKEWIAPGGGRTALRTLRGTWLRVNGTVIDARATTAQTFVDVYLAGMAIATRAPSGQYLTAVDSGGDAVLATSATMGRAEIFRIVSLPGGRAALRAPNGQFLTVGGDSKLMATSDWIDQAESFTLSYPSAFHPCYRAEANGRFLTPAAGGDVLANGTACGAAQTFTTVLP